MQRVLGSTSARLGEIVSQGPSGASKRLRTTIARVAATPNTTILVEGERGTFRTAVATHVHALSARAEEPVLALEARPGFEAALPNALEAARAGSLIIEEPARLDSAGQAALARLLADRSWQPNGQGDGDQERELQARVLATAGPDFDAAVESGQVRDDLAYRLNVLRIDLAPLRDRLEDLPALLEAFSQLETAPRPALHIDVSSLEPLRHHAWPGNLRELEGAWGRAVALSIDGRLDPTLLTATKMADEPPDSRLASLEAHWIRRVLADQDGNKSRAARALGIHRATLYHKLREYQIEVD